MRTLLILFVFMSASLTTFGQENKTNTFFCGYGEGSSPIDLCTSIKNNSFVTNKHAENATDRILGVIGLPRNFVLVSCPNIKNAVAITPADGIRYIVYDNTFMESIDKNSSAWSSLSILAHELGHHLGGHTLTTSVDLADKRKKELEADEFSGFVMFKLGSTLANAQAAIRQVANNNDDTFSTHPMLIKRLEAIQKGFLKAKAQNPITTLQIEKHPERYFAEANKFFELKAYYESIENFSKSIELNSDFFYAYFGRGVAKALIGDASGAITDFTKAIDLDPNSYKVSDYYAIRGISKIDLEDYLGAISDFNKSLDIKPEKPEFYNRGLARMKIRDYYGAISDFSKAIELDVSYDGAFNSRARCKHYLKDYLGAIRDFDKAININPNFATYFNNRALSKDQLYNFKGACEDYLKACNLGSKAGCDNYRENCN
jgi:tetratricopeptide (TPR) repeat protein